MKKHFRKLICFALIVCTVFMMGAAVFAASAPEALVTKDDVRYALGEDKKHYEVLGAAFDVSSITIASDIQGLPVTAIKESAFQNNKYINKVTIPASVTLIGDFAFRNCQNLTEVDLPTGLTLLPSGCFYDCNMLTGIALPSTLTAIGDDCFKNCTMLGKVEIPASVTEIGHDAFLNCEQLTLDVDKNAYAAQYAKQENLNTDFKNSSAYFFIMMGICIAVAAIIAVLISILLKKHIKKHPSHDPLIYIDKFFGAIGKFFSLIFGKIKAFILFLVGGIVNFFETIGKKLTAKRRANKAAKEVENEKETEIAP